MLSGVPLTQPAKVPHTPAALVSGVVAILGGLGVMEYLSLTADDVAMILGVFASFASAFYAWRERVAAKGADEVPK